MRENDYLFFLSYARSDDRDSIQEFFDDLSAEVRSYAGLPTEADVGFLDVHSMEIGAAWSWELMRALSGCRTFLALVSPRYQVSEPCGREWAVFAHRLRAFEDSDQGRPPALVPLMWLPPDRLHPIVAAVQYINDTMPTSYLRTGLRQLIRLQRHRDDYWVLLTELARHIVRCAQQHEIPRAPDGLDYHRVASVFHDESAHTPQGSAERVRFVVAAPSLAELALNELAPISREVGFYGDHAQAWAPYRPTLDIPLGEFAKAIAEERRFHAVVTDLDGLMDLLGRPGTRDQIVVLLVDLWATQLTRHRQALAECDHWHPDSGEPAAAVMVPANHDDAQTQAHLTHLMDSLRSIFIRRLAAGHDVTFRTSVLTPQSFDADLRVVLERSRNRFFSTGRVHRRPPGRSGQRPILRGP